jgi:hypothetical protein
MKNPPPKSLGEAVERLRARNDQLRAYLEGDTSAASRVANAPESSLEDATERARKYWDKLEGRRSSVPPKASNV